MVDETEFKFNNGSVLLEGARAPLPQGEYAAGEP